MQETQAGVDTLTQAYAEKWSGASGENVSAFVQFMTSNELIYVVLGVSLIIWFVLLFYLIRVDKKVTTLEKQIKSSEK